MGPSRRGQPEARFDPDPTPAPERHPNTASVMRRSFAGAGLFLAAPPVCALNAWQTGSIVEEVSSHAVFVPMLFVSITAALLLVANDGMACWPCVPPL